MPHSPGHWADTLRTMDPLLALRWGNCAERWVVERKAVTPPHELRWLLREREWNGREIAAGRIVGKDLFDCRCLEEEIISLQRGYRVIVFVAQLTPQLYDMLALSDIKRYGGYSRYADMQERKSAEREKRRRAARAGRLEDMNVEAFGRDGKRTGIYDYLTNKRRTSVCQKFLRGEITLPEALGLPRGANVLGRGGDVAHGASKIILAGS